MRTLGNKEGRALLGFLIDSNSLTAPIIYQPLKLKSRVNANGKAPQAPLTSLN